MTYWRCLRIRLHVYLEGQSITGTCCFSLCFVWAVKSRGDSDVDLFSPHRWLTAYRLVQHDSLTLEGIALTPCFPDSGFINKRQAQNSNSNLPSFLLSYTQLPSRESHFRFVEKFICLHFFVAPQHESQSEMMFDNALIKHAWFISLDY